MDSPDSTLLVVLQVVTLILALLLLVAARQARGRAGAWWWVLAFALHPATQLLRQFVSATWGHYPSLPLGHVGGAVAYALLYVGARQWLGLLPRNRFVLAACVLAALLSIAAAMQGIGFLSLAFTTCITALFEALTAVAFWQAFQRDRGVVRAAAAAVFALSALASLARAYAVVPAWNEHASILPANTFWLLTFIALCILQAGSLINLINQSLLDELRNLADFDSLTGLLNRGGLARRMRHRRAHADGTPPALAMLCMDLDHFKIVNDTHGHGAGDDVLRGIGRLLHDNARPQDLASRTGGEEFGMVVDTDSEQTLLAHAERLRAAIEKEPFPTRAGPIAITISIGAALARGDEEALETVWERADLALLEAKRAGRNRVVLGVRRSAPLPARN